MFYCEFISGVFTLKHNVYQSATTGTKFKMLIDYPMVKFSSGHHAELEIQDTWGGTKRSLLPEILVKQTPWCHLTKAIWLFISQTGSLKWEAPKLHRARSSNGKPKRLYSFQGRPQKRMLDLIQMIQPKPVSNSQCKIEENKKYTKTKCLIQKF